MHFRGSKTYLRTIAATYTRQAQAYKDLSPVIFIRENFIAEAIEETFLKLKFSHYSKVKFSISDLTLDP